MPDPDHSGKFLVCHNGKKTLSVGSEDAVLEHLDHGDTPGACTDGDARSDDERSNKGKGKGKGNGKGNGNGKKRG